MLRRLAPYILPLALAFAPARAAEYVAPYVYTAMGCQQLSSMTTATPLNVPSGAALVSLTVEVQGVRMRDDGTAPTASVGLLLPVGGPWPYSGPLSKMQFIQTASGAVVDACFYK